MILRQTLFLFIILFVPFAAGAGVLKGKVVDGQGRPLAYATIYVEGTTNGASANGDGEYELNVVPGKYSVICQYIGFQQSAYSFTISGNETIQHRFTLSPQSLEMKAVVIHANAEDPAYNIIRQAIDRRRFHLNQVKSFQSSIYLKGVMRSRAMPNKFMGTTINSSELGLDSIGKGVLYLTEEDADYYADGDKERTVIHSVHESGDKSGLGFSQFPSVITFYENNVNVFGRTSRGFISPVGDNALNYYKYKLEGEFKDKGHTIYKIEVKQKRVFEPCFNGTIYISDSDWAIHSLNMVLDKRSGMDRVDTLRIDQLFLPLQNDAWVIKSQVLFFAIKILAFDVTASGVTVYNNQRVNIPIPDSVFGGRIISSYDKTANKKDTGYWQSRPIPLAPDEKRDFVIKDSISTVQNTPRYRDSVRRKGNRVKLMPAVATGYTFTGKDEKNTYTFNPIFLSLSGENIANYNIVEGYNFAPRLNWKHVIDTGKDLHMDAVTRYGFSNHHFNAEGRVYYEQQDRSWIGRSYLIGAEGGKYVHQYNPQNPIIPWFNTYSALLFRQNDLKIYERWDATVFAGRNYGNGFNWFVRASYQQRIPLSNTTDFSIVGGGESGFTPNIPPSLATTATTWEQHDAMLFHVYMSYKPGYTYTQFPDYKMPNGSKWPRFTFTYDKGVPGILNSKTDFDKWRFSIRDNFSLKLMGRMSYHVAVGGFLNTSYVSVPDLMHLYGNRGIGYASPYMESFQFAQYYQFSNKESFYTEGHLEYHLNGLLSNKIPLLRQARYYLLFGGNAFYVNNNFYYTEAFVGIDNIGWKLFRILRVDFVQSWDSYKGHNSGIRFGLNFRQSAAGSGAKTHSEW